MRTANKSGSIAPKENRSQSRPPSVRLHANAACGQSEKPRLCETDWVSTVTRINLVDPAHVLMLRLSCAEPLRSSDGSVRSDRRFWMLRSEQNVGTDQEPMVPSWDNDKRIRRKLRCKSTLRIFQVACDVWRGGAAALPQFCLLRTCRSLRDVKESYINTDVSYPYGWCAALTNFRTQFRIL